MRLWGKAADPPSKFSGSNPFFQGFDHDRLLSFSWFRHPRLSLIHI